MDYDPLPPQVPPFEPPAGPPPAAPAPRRSSSRRRRLLIVLPLAGALVVGAIAGIGFAAAINMPRVDSLSEFSPGLITEVEDREGAIFASFARERRVMLEEGEVPELLQKAILAAEDSNFLKHGGVDAEGVLRAMLKNLLEGRRAQGGSTITMQLARRLFLTPEKAWRRKIEEAFLAVELEKHFSKQQILTLYCNMIFLGQGNYGMAAAAAQFFDKTVDELTLNEAATLAGIPQRPTAYNPYQRPELVRSRRDYVLRRMREEGFITGEELEAALGEPLTVIKRPPEKRFAPYFAEEVRKHLETSYGTQGLLDKGYRVESTLDPRIQAAAQRALRDGLTRLDRRKGWRGPIARVPAEELESHALPAWDRLDLSPGVWNQGLVLRADGARADVRFGDRVLELDAKGIAWTRRSRPRELLKPGDVAWFRLEAPASGEGEPRLMLEQEPELEGAVVVIESATGAVRAMVGGWSFERSKFNRVTQARRQVGSAFKPFVFGSALEMGYTPADTLFDAPFAIPSAPGQPPYSPRNYYREYFGIITLRRALEVSMNVTSVKLLDLVGADQVVDFGRRCGIESDLPPYPSLALGSADLVPLEVAAAYAAIANQGLYVRPYLIERILEPGGRELESHRPSAHKAMEPAVAYVLTAMLQGVVDRGTATAVADLEIDLAGKTGTTDDYSDAWFVGFTPRYTLLTWVGYDLKESIGREMTGAAAALPIWRSMIVDGLSEGWLDPGERFLAPPGVTLQPVEYYSGLLPGPGAERIIEETFVEGTQPALQFEPRWARILALEWYQQRPYYLPKAGERMPEQVEDWTEIEQAWADKE